MFGESFCNSVQHPDAAPGGGGDHRGAPDWTKPIGAGAAVGFPDPHGGDRRSAPDVLRGAGDEPEGADEDRSFPISFRDCTVMLTLVAVMMTPMKTAL